MPSQTPKGAPAVVGGVDLSSFISNDNKMSNLMNFEKIDLGGIRKDSGLLNLKNQSIKSLKRLEKLGGGQPYHTPSRRPGGRSLDLISEQATYEELLEQTNIDGEGSLVEKINIEAVTPSSHLNLKKPENTDTPARMYAPADSFMHESPSRKQPMASTIPMPDSGNDVELTFKVKTEESREDLFSEEGFPVNEFDATGEAFPKMKNNLQRAATAQYEIQGEGEGP